MVWRKHRAEDYVLDFDQFCGKQTPYSVAYAVCYLVCGKEHNGLQMRIGSDDQSKVYLNGQEVFKQVKARGIGKDQDVVREITLKKGVNVVVFKVVNEILGSAGCLRFTDKDGKPFTDFRVRLASTSRDR